MATDPTETTSHLCTEAQSNQIRTNSLTLPRVTRLNSADGDEISDRSPLYKKYEAENKLINNLSSILKSEDLSDLQLFATRLLPVVHAVIERQQEDEGRPIFHYKVATVMIYFFVDKHPAFNEEELHLSPFKSIVDASSMPSAEKLETLIHVLATLFVLAGPLIFTRPKALELLINLLNSIPSHTTDTIGELRLLAFRCLIWSFSRITEWEIIPVAIWQNALLVIEPHLEVIDIPHIVACLLSRRCLSGYYADNHLGERLASMFVYTIAERRDDQWRVITFDILCQLLLGSCSREWPASSLTLDYYPLIGQLMKEAPQAQDRQKEPACSPTMLRELSKDEIRASWNFLASACHSFVEAEVKNASCSQRQDMELSHDVVEMWRVLVHASGEEASFVQDLSKVHASLFGEGAIRAVLQLWLITMNELGIAVRSAVAEMILRQIFERRDIYINFSGKAEREWLRLLDELVFCDPQRALAALENIGVNAAVRTFVQQKTWCDIVHYVVIRDVVRRGVRTYFSVGELVAFLQFPFKMGFEDADEYVRLLWDELLPRTWTIAEERRRPAMVLDLMEEIARALGLEGINREEWPSCDDVEHSRERRKERWVGRGRWSGEVR